MPPREYLSRRSRGKTAQDSSTGTKVEGNGRVPPGSPQRTWDENDGRSPTIAFTASVDVSVPKGRLIFKLVQFRLGNKLFALYQGTTLVVPKGATKSGGFSVCVRTLHLVP